MTDEQHPAQFDWATELSDAQGRVTLSEQEAHEIGARLRSIGEKLKTYEDLGDAGSDVQLLRMGYAAARLEIASLQARIKTMTEEHADELTVAHLDGRMRAAQVMFNGLTEEETMATASCIGLMTEPAGEYPPLPEWSKMDNLGGLVPSEIRQELRAYVDSDRAMRAAQHAVVMLGEQAELRRLSDCCPELNLSNYGPDDVGELNGWAIEVSQCIDRALAAQHAGAQEPGAAYADLMQEASDWICEHVQNETTGAMMWAIRLQSAAQKLRASHGQAPSQAAPAAMHSDLRARCVEVLAWRETGTLPGEALRTLAREKYGDRYDAIQRAERDTETEALNLVAAAPTTQPAPQQEALRLAKYVARRKLAKQLDTNEIHGFDSGCDTEAVLLLSDIEAVLSQVAALTAAPPAGARL